jgi:integrase
VDKGGGKRRGAITPPKNSCARPPASAFPGFACTTYGAAHETLLLDAGVPVHVVAARCGHDPAVLLRSYAKRTRKADKSAADAIAKLSRGTLGNGR